MIVGCYTLDLYCDNEGSYPDGIHEFKAFPEQYTGETLQECVKPAKKRGWKLDFRRGIALCPICAKKTKIK